MIAKLFDTYLSYLANHPERIDSIWLWTITNIMVWMVMFKYRTKMIVGMEGTNGLWEANEQVSYLLCWLFPPILTYSAFFHIELPSWVWYFLSFGVAYTLGGRWLLEWVLAFKTGSNKVGTENKNP